MATRKRREREEREQREAEEEQRILASEQKHMEDEDEIEKEMMSTAPEKDVVVDNAEDNLNLDEMLEEMDDD